MAPDINNPNIEFKKVIDNIDIPPHPEVLSSFLDEQNKAEPDLKAIGNLLSKDVAISAGILKTVNSSFFGLRQKVASIQQAVMLLGIKNVNNLVLSMALKKAFGGESSEFLENFWNRCNTIALLSAKIGNKVSHVAADEIYTSALMCDCAVPLLSKKFPEYNEFYLKYINDNNNYMPEIEEHIFMAGHPGFGEHIAKAWKFPLSISLLIAHHHDIDLELLYDYGELATVYAIYNFAVCVYNHYKGMEAHYEWLKLGPELLSLLKIEKDDVPVIEEELFALLNE